MYNYYGCRKQSICCGSRHKRICKLLKKRSEIQVGGGIRSTEHIKKLIDYGVDKIILGTIAVEDIKFLNDVCNEFNNKILLNPELTFGYRTLINGEKQEYQVNGSDLTFDNGVQEDGFGKFALKANYLVSENANLFLNTSAKKTTEDQETFSINIGYKNVF